VKLPQESADYVMEVAEIAAVSPSVVVGVLVANSIYHAKRTPTTHLHQLRRARACMEANDPLNARDIFGPPLDQPQSGKPDAEGGTPVMGFHVDEMTGDDEPHPVCPNCGSVNVTKSREVDEFPYGVAPNTVALKAEVEVMACGNCKERWTGEQGEQARKAAVDAYLLTQPPFNGVAP
jgi:hypothetical protein